MALFSNAVRSAADNLSSIWIVKVATPLASVALLSPPVIATPLILAIPKPTVTP